MEKHVPVFFRKKLKNESLFSKYNRTCNPGMVKKNQTKERRVVYGDQSLGK